MPHLRAHPGKRSRNAPSRPLDLPVGFSASCYPKSVIMPEGPVPQDRARDSPQGKKQKHPSFEDEETMACPVLRVLLDSVGLIEYLHEISITGCRGATGVLLLGDAGLADAGITKIVHRRKLLNAARSTVSVPLHKDDTPSPALMSHHIDDQPPELICEDIDEVDVPPPLVEETA